MEMATYLQEHTALSLTEIARYVGYQSYAGFWKAMKSQKENDAFSQKGKDAVT